LATGSILWLLVVAIRFARAPESSMLQAAGAFRSLAFASVFSCAFSVIGVLALLLLAGPLWSIAGTIIGELVFAAWTWRQARRLQLTGEQARIGDRQPLHRAEAENV
jgi:O-antigen/teichoic acid export membrane protein